MRLVTASDTAGRTFPGVQTDGGIVDIAPLGFPSMDAVLERGVDEVRKALHAADGPINKASLLAPLTPRVVIVSGTNYRSHVAEMGASEPRRPTANVVKLPGSVCGPGDSIEIPEGCLLDYEGEIAVVIGRPVSTADLEHAYDAILGLCLANDLSARDAPTTHLTLAKSGRGFCPLGPAIVTLDEVDLDKISFEVFVNGELRQSGDASDLVHSLLEVVASYAASLPLWPGDVILTGSPGGVGAAMDPPTFLRAGDVVEIVSDQLGRLTNSFVGPTTVTASENHHREGAGRK